MFILCAVWFCFPFSQLESLKEVQDIVEEPSLFCGCLHCNSWSLKSWNNGRGIHRHRTKHLSLSSYSVMLEQSSEYFSGSCVPALMNFT